MNQKFEIKDTRFVEVLISYQMKKKRNVLSSKLRYVKIFQKCPQFSDKKKSNTMHPKKKKTRVKTFFSTF